MVACVSEPGPVVGRTPASDPQTHDTGGDEDAVIPQVGVVARLARLSLDLRGTRPSLAEIESVQADDAVLEDYAAAWVREDAYLDRVGWIWNDAVHTAVWSSTYTRFGDLSFDQWRVMGQEPLRIVRAVVAEDRPFSDVITSGQLQVHPTLADLWDDPHRAGLAGSGARQGTPGQSLAC